MNGIKLPLLRGSLADIEIDDTIPSSNFFSFFVFPLFSELVFRIISRLTNDWNKEMIEVDVMGACVIINSVKLCLVSCLHCTIILIIIDIKYKKIINNSIFSYPIFPCFFLLFPEEIKTRLKSNAWSIINNLKTNVRHYR